MFTRASWLCITALSAVGSPAFAHALAPTDRREHEWPGNGRTLPRDPLESMTAAEIIRHWGYPVESHDVVTDDGFVLEMLRIPHGRRLGMGAQSARVVTWVDEMAKYDAPAAIDKVLQLNGAGSLYWVAHSQGTIIGFMMPAERPEYNQKVRALFQLGTVGTMHYAKGIARMIIKLSIAFRPLTRVRKFNKEAIKLRELSSEYNLDAHEVGFHNPAVMGDATRILCPPAKVGQLCYNLISHYTGHPSKAFNWVGEVFSDCAFRSRAPIYFSHSLLSTSSWTLLQYIQNSDRNSVDHFDSSPMENLRRYGTVQAPPYNYSNIKSDVYLFWSRSDWMTTPREITKWWIPHLKKGVIKGAFETPSYSHADWIFATDLKDRVFNRIISIVRKHEKNACHE
ncbi:hypothetical protein PRIPAC_95060 [Pristionchus pacificus]|uniref:Hydrolase n=1 Tax=Pristionchus pacificus TaxID=54126 RepID=A0A2A6BID5_PRIPA|nr:hypothetical protein PRIPAC_95060 [Pristionchus pacificus]|eukprot:PDM65647.1 hydrolase [Pristionchus pacificus]